MTPRHGLVIGKFYPPHAGHHLLVRTAAACCERVTVVVMAATAESIPLALRVEWLREVHRDAPHVAVVGTMDDHPVDLESDAVWRAHVGLMQAAAAQVTPAPVDAVFTSEGYGDELARRLGARHVQVDADRRLAPISATRVRADPVSAWPFLAEPVRGWFARRLVVVGAESTGKTTFAEALCEALRARGGPHGLTRWVPEYGRELTVELLARERARAQLAGRPRPRLEDLPWATPDFLRVAEEQSRREAREACRGGPVLVCDTDAFATGLWHERYVGARSPEVDGLARRGDLYLLTDPADVPFEDDGLRDGQHLRDWMTAAFVERLEATGRRWRWLRGGRAERVAAGLAAVDGLLAAGWALAKPLG
ncbi:MAG: AAA family ATPase [Anaeromyxobacter sp.]